MTLPRALEPGSGLEKPGIGSIRVRQWGWEADLTLLRVGSATSHSSLVYSMHYSCARKVRLMPMTFLNLHKSLVQPLSQVETSELPLNPLSITLMNSFANSCTKMCVENCSLFFFYSRVVLDLTYHPFIPPPVSYSCQSNAPGKPHKQGAKANRKDTVVPQKLVFLEEMPLHMQFHPAIMARSVHHEFV